MKAEPSATDPQATHGVAIVDDERFDAHVDPSGHHPECPDRLVAARDGLGAALTRVPQHRVPVREATTEELERVHAPHYLAGLRARLADGQGHLDADTFFSHGTRQAAWLAAGGVIDLARKLVAGPQRRGFALVRPPGHHAEPHSSMGFCLLNNIALAASAALAEGLSRVAIVDFDVHHGNATQHMFYDDPRVLFVSLHQYPFYPGTGAAREIGADTGRGYTVNLALPAGCGPETYGVAFSEVVLPVLRAHAPELLLVSAGFDAHARDPLASMQLDASSYAAMATALIDVAREHAQGRIGFVLEGGYDLYALRDSVAAVGRALAGDTTELPRGRLRAGEREAIDAVRGLLLPHWQLTAHS